MKRAIGAIDDRPKIIRVERNRLRRKGTAGRMSGIGSDL